MNSKLILKNGSVVEYYRDNQDDLETYQGLSEPHIVCAAILYNYSEEPVVITGARHMDCIMRPIFKLMSEVKGCCPVKIQGFIDQHGRFYDRRNAMKVVIASGQPFDAKRNGGNGDELYSEGIY
jgi:hypothetical protein